jgi:hypothetical protein
MLFEKYYPILGYSVNLYSDKLKFILQTTSRERERERERKRNIMILFSFSELNKDKSGVCCWKEIMTFILKWIFWRKFVVGS